MNCNTNINKFGRFHESTAVPEKMQRQNGKDVAVSRSFFSKICKFYCVEATYLKCTIPNIDMIVGSPTGKVKSIEKTDGSREEVYVNQTRI